MTKSPLIFIIAGEASGDLLGGDLMASLKSLQEVRFAGIGGQRMQEQGLQSLFPMEELSIMGVWGIIKKLPHLLGRISYTVEKIQKLKPDVVITIDAPEFSFRVMKRLHNLPDRPKLIHYVAPTVWAWRPGRAKKIASFLDQLLCLYPFEPPMFEKHGLKSIFVGHPIGKNDNILEFERNPNLLCVLPGSRKSEVQRLLPIFGETVALLKRDKPDIEVVIPTLPSLMEMIKGGTSGWEVKTTIIMDADEQKKAFAQSYVALAKSGTVALQLTAARLPFVIAYKVNRINEWMGRLLINTPWACMVNIIMAFHKYGKDFVLNKESTKLEPKPWIPEFIQENCTSGKLAPAIKTLFLSLEERDRQLKAMDEVMTLLKAPPDAAAKAVLGNASSITSPPVGAQRVGEG
jgi:lipid-A-disaccharide synthase